MDDYEKFNETSLTEKEDFCSHLNMEDITDADYAHTKRVCKNFKMKNWGNVMICIFKSMHYCYLMYLRTFKICILNYMNSTLLVFLLRQDWHGKQP